MRYGMIQRESFYKGNSDENGFRVLIERVWLYRAHRVRVTLNVKMEHLLSFLLDGAIFSPAFALEAGLESDFFNELKCQKLNRGLISAHGSRDGRNDAAIALRMYLKNKGAGTV